MSQRLLDLLVKEANSSLEEEESLRRKARNKRKALRKARREQRRK